MHLAPSEGLPRNVAAPVIDMLYPPGKPSRIPIIAVTGTNGKTTTTRLLAHIVKNNGFKVGFTTSDGIYVQNHMMEKGDTTGPVSAEYILKDPTVEFAVLETNAEQQRLVFDKLTIDSTRREVILSNEPIPLTSLEFDLLYFLASHPARVWRRSELIQEVWDYEYVGDQRVVDVHIGQIRKKIEIDPTQSTLIHTIRGVGYKFECTTSS
jgi:DNA-binding response OmpR family regulator